MSARNSADPGVPQAEPLVGRDAADRHRPRPHRRRPTWDPPTPPPGYGDPHTPGGGFRAQTKALVTAAGAWDDVAGALKTAWSHAAKGYDDPYLFGEMDALYTAGNIHRGINEDLVNAAEDGYGITTGLANGLVEVANDFENTDTTVGTNFRTLEGRA